MKRLARSQAGFTLLEIMLVVMIIAMLATAAIFGVTGHLQQSRMTRADADIQTIKTQLLMYQSSNGQFPTTEQGLKALVTRPTTDPKPRRWVQLLKDVPEDPWHKPYVYERPGRRSQEGFDLYTTGENPDDPSDDIGNWK